MSHSNVLNDITENLRKLNVISVNEGITEAAFRVSLQELRCVIELLTYGADARNVPELLIPADVQNEIRYNKVLEHRQDAANLNRIQFNAENIKQLHSNVVHAFPLTFLPELLPNTIDKLDQIVSIFKGSILISWMLGGKDTSGSTQKTIWNRIRHMYVNQSEVMVTNPIVKLQYNYIFLKIVLTAIYQSCPMVKAFMEKGPSVDNNNNDISASNSVNGGFNFKNEYDMYIIAKKALRESLKPSTIIENAQLATQIGNTLPSVNHTFGVNNVGDNSDVQQQSPQGSEQSSGNRNDPTLYTPAPAGVVIDVAAMEEVRRNADKITTAQNASDRHLRQSLQHTFEVDKEVRQAAYDSMYTGIFAPVVGLPSETKTEAEMADEIARYILDAPTYDDQRHKYYNTMNAIANRKTLNSVIKYVPKREQVSAAAKATKNMALYIKNVVETNTKSAVAKMSEITTMIRNDICVNMAIERATQYSVRGAVSVAEIIDAAPGFLNRTNESALRVATEYGRAAEKAVRSGVTSASGYIENAQQAALRNIQMDFDFDLGRRETERMIVDQEQRVLNNSQGKAGIEDEYGGRDKMEKISLDEQNKFVLVEEFDYEQGRQKPGWDWNLYNFYSGFKNETDIGFKYAGFGTTRAANTYPPMDNDTEYKIVYDLERLHKHMTAIIDHSLSKRAKWHDARCWFFRLVGPYGRKNNIMYVRGTVTQSNYYSLVEYYRDILIGFRGIDTISSKGIMFAAAHNLLTIYEGVARALSVYVKFGRYSKVPSTGAIENGYLFIVNRDNILSPTVFSNGYAKNMSIIIQETVIELYECTLKFDDEEAILAKTRDTENRKRDKEDQKDNQDMATAVNSTAGKIVRAGYGLFNAGFVQTLGVVVSSVVGGYFVGGSYATSGMLAQGGMGALGAISAAVAGKFIAQRTWAFVTMDWMDNLIDGSKFTPRSKDHLKMVVSGLRNSVYQTVATVSYTVFTGSYESTVLDTLMSNVILTFSFAVLSLSSRFIASLLGSYTNLNDSSIKARYPLVGGILVTCSKIITGTWFSESAGLTLFKPIRHWWHSTMGAFSGMNVINVISMVAMGGLVLFTRGIAYGLGFDNMLLETVAKMPMLTSILNRLLDSTKTLAGSVGLVMPVMGLVVDSALSTFANLIGSRGDLFGIFNSLSNVGVSVWQYAKSWLVSQFYIRGWASIIEYMKSSNYIMNIASHVGSVFSVVVSNPTTLVSSIEVVLPLTTGIAIAFNDANGAIARTVKMDEVSQIMKSDLKNWAYSKPELFNDLVVHCPSTNREQCIEKVYSKFSDMVLYDPTYHDFSSKILDKDRIETSDLPAFMTNNINRNFFVAVDKYENFYIKDENAAATKQWYALTKMMDEDHKIYSRYIDNTKLEEGITPKKLADEVADFNNNPAYGKWKKRSAELRGLVVQNKLPEDGGKTLISKGLEALGVTEILKGLGANPAIATAGGFLYYDILGNTRSKNALDDEDKDDTNTTDTNECKDERDRDREFYTMFANIQLQQQQRMLMTFK